MNNKGIKKELIRLTWPIFIETLLFVTLGTVDTIMLSRYSDKAVAAVSVSNQIASFINLLFGVITVGTAILCSQYKGAEDKEHLSIVAAVSLVFNAFMGVILSIVLVVFARPILKFMNVPNETIGYAVDYLVIVGGGAFVQAILSTISAVVRSHGYTKLTMKLTIIMNIVNIIGNYIFIFGHFGVPQMGVAGSAISTTLSRVAAAITAFYILKHKVDKNISLKILKPFPFDMLRKVLKIGLPSAGENLSYNTSQLFITSFVASMGSVALAAKAYITNITLIAIIFSSAIGQGTSILVGIKIGAEKRDDADRICMYSVKLGIAIACTVAVLSAVLSRPLTGIFTSDVSIIKLAATVLVIDIFVEFGKVFNVVIISSLKAAGDVRFPVYWGIASMWGVSVVFAYLLGVKMNLGLAGIWIACGMDECLRGIIMLVRWKKGKWKTLKLI